MSDRVRVHAAEIDAVADALPGWTIRRWGAHQVAIEHPEGWSDLVRVPGAAWHALLCLSAKVNAGKVKVDPIEEDRRDWDAEPRW